jgi:putative (di)nucleoside polyphosphate hydrolase
MSKSIEDLPYRPCVGVALFNRDDLVWIGKRTKISVEGPGGWQMPQGGLDEGEEPEQGAFRELYEETSVRHAEVIRAAPGWVTYDLPPDLVPKLWGGKYRGQKQKWFALRFTGKDADIDVLKPGGGNHKPEFSDWRWEKLERLPELIVPFKRKVYEAVVKAFRDIPGAR